MLARQRRQSGVFFLGQTHGNARGHLSAMLSDSQDMHHLTSS